MPQLASVIRSGVPTYPKVDDNHPLALFHARFLGKSMKVEEAEWQEGREDQDKYEEDQNQGEATDEDDDEATDDDILPGCYVLDIGIHGMIPERLWIRADYIRIFDFFQEFYDDYQSRRQVPSAVLTGQPGIGKSFWIYYAARRLLAERRPFIWFYEADYYLFVDDGIYKLPPDWRHSDFTSIIWTLVDESDADQNKADVLEILIPHGTRLFVMYVTSPAADRWSRMHKTTKSVVVIMNPWGRSEIQRAARLLPVEGITETHVNEIFDQLGPIPRLCIDWAPDQLAQYKDQLHQAILKISTNDILKLFHDASGLTMDSVSQKICLLSRQRRDHVYSKAVVAPITHAIQSKLAIRFRTLPRAELVRLYQLFENTTA